MDLIVWDKDVQGARARAWLVIAGDLAQAQGTVEALGFSLESNGHTAVGHLVLQGPVPFPAVLAVPENGGSRLASWEEARNNAAAEWRQRERDIQAFVDTLRNTTVQLGGTSASGIAARFLGAEAVAGATAACTLNLDIGALLGKDDTAPVFSALLAADLAAFACAPVGTAAVAAQLSFSLVLTRDSLLQLLPRITLPQLPGVAIRWPRLRLPAWDGEIGFPSFPGLGQLDLDGLFALPLPASLLAIELNPAPVLSFVVTNDTLEVTTTSPGAGTIRLQGGPVLLAFHALELNISATVQALSASFSAPGNGTVDLPDIGVPEALSGPFDIRLSGIGVAASGTVNTGSGGVALDIALDIQRIDIRARTDPSLSLSLSARLAWIVDDGRLRPRLDRLTVIEPYPLELVDAAAHVIADGARRLWALVQTIPMPGAPASPTVPSLAGVRALLGRLGDMLMAAAQWLALKGMAAARVLADVAEGALGMLGRLLEALAAPATPAFAALAIEFRVDLSTLRLVQVVISPLEPIAVGGPEPISVLGLELTLPYSLAPSLVCDLEAGWTALVVNTDAGQNHDIVLSTDLWLDSDGPTEAVGGTSSGNAHEPLLSITATPGAAPRAVALVVLQDGKARFFHEVLSGLTPSDITGNNGQVVIGAGTRLIGVPIVLCAKVDDEVAFEVDCDTDRILSLFKAPGAPGDPGPWSQYIKIDSVAVAGPPANGVVRIVVEGEVKVSGLGMGENADPLPIELVITLDMTTLSAQIESGGVDIVMANPTTFSLLGLNGRVRDIRTPPVPGSFAPFRLEFNGGNPRIAMNAGIAALDLSYDQLSAGGGGLEFTVKSFAVARDGIDLEAVTKDNPVTLAGVDMPFRFDSGALTVKAGRIQSFGLTGHGNLPPALVGEAKATIVLNFAQRGDRLALQTCDAVLDKSGDPLRCESTRFTLNIDKLGLKVVEQSGYQFYFTLTGYAQFRPNGGEFADGLLKNLSKLKIVLREVPLASDPRVLMQHIEFQVPVEPPDRTNFFDIFAFKLKGIGFHPASPAFDGAPAISISGQVEFTDFCDNLNPRFDFHQLWIAPPKAGECLPRIRFDGLGVGLTLGSAAEVSATAIAVDGKLPTLEGAAPPELGVTAKGFLASGSLTLKGWASMSAAMGFLELEKAGHAEKRHAFFLYIQQNDISIPVVTPIGKLYIRELGYGLGYRYTLAGLAAADQAETPRQLVALLDGVSRYQGDLHKFGAWAPTYDNSDLTLAMRALVSMASLSPEHGYNPKEKEVPNPVLFDIVAALRTDLTFLMNLRAWIAFNYSDWRAARMKGGEPWQQKPALTGYMYVSVRKQEFLARLVSHPDCEIGTHPALYPPLIQAMKAVRWSSTLYVRPGLYHHEMGWPYELGFAINSPQDNLYLSVEGGTVLRIEDASLLYGLAFRARGHMRFAAGTGGDFGASVSALASFALAAKFIAYLSAGSERSMLYGTLSLDITIEFSVHVWLDTKFFSASADFAASFTIHVAAELAITTSVSGRIEASVSVGAFGRSLTLGIGFGIGSQTDLGEARQRSERFLTLGLGSDYPDPEAGVPVNRPPLPQPAPAANAARADAEVVRTAEHRENQGRKESEREPAVLARVAGTAVGDTRFNAMLYPVESDDGKAYYLVQFIPASEQYPGPDQGDHFYAAPVSAPGGEPEYEVVLSSGAFVPAELMSAPGQQAIAGSTVRCSTNWQATMGRRGSGAEGRDAPPTLAQYFSVACFMAPTDGQQLTNCRALRVRNCVLPDDPAARNAILARASRSRAGLGDAEARAMQVREARSAFIATVGEAASRLAAAMAVRDGAAVLPSAEQLAQLELDPRALGLSFLLTGARVAEIFGLDAGAGAPGQPLVGIRSRLPRLVPVLSDPVAAAAFNPPHRMFRQGAPRLADRSFRLFPGGVHLSWDLEPAWRSSRSVEDDPEYHLKHYHIERRLKGTRLGRKVFTVKPSTTLEFDLGAGRLEAIAYGSRLVLVDDLADLPDALRARILPAALAADAAARGGDAGIQGDLPELFYLIQPVDCAGTAGHPFPCPVSVPRPAPRQPGFGRPIARFRYPALPALGRWPAGSAGAVPEDFLSLYVEEPSIAPGPDPALAPLFAADPQPIALRLRTERTIAIGVFGADALTQARAAPPVPDADRAAGANETDLLIFPLDGPKAPPGNIVLKLRRVPMGLSGYRAPDPERDGETVRYRLPAADWQRMRKALDIPPDDAHVRRTLATRLYLRPQPLEGAGLLRPEWVPVQLQLQVGAAPAAASRAARPPLPAPPVDITVERFEHPVDLRFQALRGDVYPDSGRLYVLHPEATATYASCDALPLADAQRRTAVRIAWDAQPDSLAAIGAPLAAAADLQTMVGGFDLFMLDTAAVPAGGDPLEHVAHVGRVQRLPSAERGQDPVETGDLATVEVLYPSLTRRIRHGAPGARTPWYSGAESFLRWPRRVVRRSLVTSLDEVEIARLFADGRPTMLELNVDTTLAIAIDPVLGARFTLAAVGAGQYQASLVRTGQGNVEALTPDLARRLLLALVDDAPAGSLPAPRPDLKVRGVTKGGQWQTGQADIVTAKPAALHPVLADVLDLVRYRNLADPAARLYRGLELVSEAAPPVTATTLTGFFDDTVAERDPAGWGVLRSLGLAAAFRLYDLDAGAFLDPAGLHAALGTALDCVLRRYAVDRSKLGAPFANIMSSTEALAQLVSFDGSAPKDARGADRIKADSLSFVQLELRPVAEALAASPSASPAIRYASLVWTAPDPLATAEDFPAAGIALQAGHFARGILAEVEPAASADGSARRRALLLDGWVEPNFPLGGDDALDQGIVLGRSGLMDGQGNEVLGWVRLINFFGNVDLGPGVFVPGALPGRLQLLLSPKPGADTGGPADPLADERSPWGRFAALPERWQAALEFRDGLDKLTGAAAPSHGDTLAAVMEALKPLADSSNVPGLASLPTPVDTSEAAAKHAEVERRALAGKLAAWCQRYMDKGPARQLTNPERADQVGVAFAMLTRPKPWRSAPDSEGRMSVLLFEKDRYGKARKYAVRPFARYESLAIATLAAAAAEAGLPQALARARHAAWADLARPNLLTPGVFGTPLPAAFLSTHFADVMLERSEPLAPPVVLATRSRGSLVKRDKPHEPDVRHERFIEIVVARHPEEILSEANIGTDAGLAMRHVGVGFWRQFMAPDWVRRVEGGTGVKPLSIDELAAFGPHRPDRVARLHSPAPLSIDKDSNVPVCLGELAGTLPDLWTGASVLRLLNMPYGFRLLASAHVAAGVVVSAPNAVSVEGPDSRLERLPWQRTAVDGAPASPHWQEQPVTRLPSYALRREAGQVLLDVSWPLVRLLDGMEPDTRRLWFEGEDAPAVFRIPDPGVAYRLCVATDDDMLSVPEVLVSPIPEPEPGSGVAGADLYAVEAVGTRFQVPEAAAIELAAPTHYQLRSSLQIEGPAVAQPAAQFSPRLDAFPLPSHYLLPATDVGLWQAWAGILPWPGAGSSPAGSTLGLTLTPPALPDPPAFPPMPPHQAWADFRQQLADYIVRLQAYAVGGMPADVAGAATAVANALAPYAVDRVANWPGPKAGNTAQPASFTLPWVLGLPVNAPGLTLATQQHWHWPDGSMAAMNAAARTAAAQVFAALIANAGAAAQPPLRQAAGAVLVAMRQFVIDERRRLDDIPYAGIEPVTEALPPDANLANWPVSDAHDALAVLPLAAAARSVADVDAAFDAIEAVPGAGPTLAALAAMRRVPEGATELPLRWSARTAIEPALQLLASAGGGAAADYQAVALVVRAPLLGAEIAALGAVDLALPARAEAITRRMLFGPRRKLVLQAMQGQKPPLESEVGSTP